MLPITYIHIVLLQINFLGESPASAQQALTCELVAGDIGALEAGAGAQVWKGTLQLVVLQLDALEVGQVCKLGRDIAANAVVCQIQALQ